MRTSISILLVALFAGIVYAAPLDCCDAATLPANGDACHHVPARYMPCDQVQVTRCMGFVCEAELSTFVAPIAAGTARPTGELSYIQSPGGIPPRMRSVEEPAMADHVAFRNIFGELYLRNRVLRI